MSKGMRLGVRVAFWCLIAMASTAVPILGTAIYIHHQHTSSTFHQRRELQGLLYRFLQSSTDVASKHRDDPQVGQSLFGFIRQDGVGESLLQQLCSRGRVVLNPDIKFWTDQPQERMDECAIVFEAIDADGSRWWAALTISGRPLNTTSTEELPEWYPRGVAACAP